MPVGLVVERRELDNRWQRFAWKPVEVVPHGPEAPDWCVIVETPKRVRYYAGRLTLDLFRGETDAYIHNLTMREPVVYCVMRMADGMDPEARVTPLLVTVNPFEAEEYLVAGEEIVEGVPLPPEVAAWMQAFVERHHVERTFVKRARSDAGPGASSRFMPPRRRARGGEREGPGGGDG